MKSKPKIEMDAEDKKIRNARRNDRKKSERLYRQLNLVDAGRLHPDDVIR